MTIGMTAKPSDPRKIVVTNTDVKGRPSMTQVMLPMPMAAPATMGRPGRWDMAMPKAAPMNMPGKVGPPRKAPRDPPYANPLQATSSTKVPTEKEAPFVKSEGSEDWPEKSTSDDGFPVPS